MPEKWMRPADAAEHLGLAVQTLANWRVLGKGPAYLRVGRLVRYEPSAVDEWQQAQTLRHLGERASVGVVELQTTHPDLMHRVRHQTRPPPTEEHVLAQDTSCLTLADTPLHRHPLRAPSPDRSHGASDAEGCLSVAVPALLE